MRAILIAMGVVENGGALNERNPSVLLSLVDRPFIQHVVEYIIAQGVDEIDFVLSHLPDQIESFLGTGDRWGAKFHFHLSRDPSRPYESLRAIDLSAQDEVVLVGHAERLPAIFGSSSSAQSALGNQLYDAPSPDQAGKATWTGWARLQASVIPALAQASNEADLANKLMAADGVRHTVATTLDTRTYRGLLAAQKLLLANQFAGLLSTGLESEPGIRRAGTAEVFPGVQLIAPVYLGEHCRIMAGAVVGPYAVVCADAVLDRRCSVANSLICPGTYVGLDPEFRSMAWLVAVQDLGDPFAQLLESTLLASEDSLLRRDAAWALGMAEDPKSSARALALSLHPGIRTSELYGLLGGQFMSPVTRAAAWAWLRENLDDVMNELPGFEKGRMFGVAESFCDASLRPELDRTLSAKSREIGSGELEVQRALEGLDLCVAQRTALGPSVVAALGMQ